MSMDAVPFGPSSILDDRPPLALPDEPVRLFVPISSSRPKLGRPPPMRRLGSALIGWWPTPAPRRLLLGAELIDIDLKPKWNRG